MPQIVTEVGIAVVALAILMSIESPEESVENEQSHLLQQRALDAGEGLYNSSLFLQPAGADALNLYSLQK